MNIFFEQFLGFAIGVSASWLFLWMIRFMKPNVELTPVIAHRPAKDELVFKIINRGRRQATNITVDIRIFERQTTQGGTWRRVTIFQSEPHIREIPALDSWYSHRIWEPWGESMPESHQFRCKEANHILKLLREDSENERRVVFTVSSTDAISSVQVVKRRYYTSENIQEGEFNDEFRISSQDMKVEV